VLSTPGAGGRFLSSPVLVTEPIYVTAFDGTNNPQKFSVTSKQIMMSFFLGPTTPVLNRLSTTGGCHRVRRSMNSMTLALQKNEGGIRFRPTIRSRQRDAYSHPTDRLGSLPLMKQDRR